MPFNVVVVIWLAPVKQVHLVLLLPQLHNIFAALLAVFRGADEYHGALNEGKVEFNLSVCKYTH